MLVGFNAWMILPVALFFSALGGPSGVELWKSDGTAAGTVLGIPVLDHVIVAPGQALSMAEKGLV